MSQRHLVTVAFRASFKRTDWLIWTGRSQRAAVNMRCVSVNVLRTGDTTWLSGNSNTLVSIKVVALRRARLVPGWVT